MGMVADFFALGFKVEIKRAAKMTLNAPG